MQPFLLACALLAISASAQVQQVAVIGGGVGGASSAYYLKELLGDQVNVTIFEKSDVLGGRTSSWEAGGVAIELGASIGWTGNQYLRYLAGEAGLSLKEAGGSSSGEGSKALLTVFDGKSLVFRQSQWDLLTLLRMLWRYGLSYFQIKGYPMRMSSKFAGVYEIQRQGTAFDRPEQLLSSLGLYDLTQQNLLEYIRNEFGTSIDLFASEVVAGVGRVNYNQNNLQLNALAGMVSLLPAVDPSVFSIEGGNQQLAPRLASTAGAAVLQSHAVAEIARASDGRFELNLGSGVCGCLGCVDSHGEREGVEDRSSYRSDVEITVDRQGAAHQQQVLVEGGAGHQGKWRGGEQLVFSAQREQERQHGGDEEGQPLTGPPPRRCDARCLPPAQRGGAGEAGGTMCGTAPPLFSQGLFDAVIVAAPLEGSGLRFRGVDMPRIPPRKYQTTVTTLVQGRLRPQYFGLQDSMPFTEVLVTEDASTPFSSLSLVGRVAEGADGGNRSPVYKLFSQQPLADAHLAAIFQPGFAVVVSKSWKAYPRFDPPEDFAPFKLADGLYYGNALESAASAMEMAAVAGRNSALLAAQYLVQQKAA